MSSSLASEDRKVDYEEKGGNQLDTDVASAETHAKQTHRPIAWLWKVAKKLDSYGVEVSLFFSLTSLKSLASTRQPPPSPRPSLLSLWYSLTSWRSTRVSVAVTDALVSNFFSSSSFLRHFPSITLLATFPHTRRRRFSTTTCHSPTFLLLQVRGVERVPPNERFHTGVYDAGYLWGSANMTISTFSLGTLATNIYGLGPTDACLTALFFNLLTTLPVALFSCWGKSTGLRQMMIGRFSFGTVWIWFPIILNCVACVGWVSRDYFSFLFAKDRRN